MEALIHQHRTRRPSGEQVVIEEHWEFVDVSLRRTGTDWAPGGKRFALSKGECVHKIDDGVFQVAATGEILIAS